MTHTLNHMSLTIIDYGMGNLRSVQKAFEAAGAQSAAITDDPARVKSANKLVLPGVGAMAPAMEKLEKLGMVPAIKAHAQAGKPFLGICLGLQLLFDESDEGGRVKGLGLLKGRVTRFTGTIKVPHMGWNELTFTDAGKPLFAGLGSNPFAYFCHSYFVVPADNAVSAAMTTYGKEFSAAVHRDNIWGVQFHPEKSQETGLRILKNFVDMKS